MEGSQVSVGDGAPPSGGGLLSNKRNLLIIAAILGGGAGLVILMSRHSGGGSASAPGATPMSQTDLQLGNLANQLLQFRGETSIQNADITAAIGSATDTQKSIAADLTGTLGTNQNALVSLLQALGIQIGDVNKGITGISGQVSGVSGQVSGVSSQVVGVGRQVADVGASQDAGFNQIGYQFGVTQQQAWANWLNLMAGLGRPVNGDTTGPFYWMTADQMTTNNLMAQLAANGATRRTGAVAVDQQPLGAGGFSTVEFIGGVADAGDGSAEEWSNLMSAGPVRYI